MNLNDPSPELKEKALSCKTPEEIIRLARDEGVELTDEQLQQVTGGWGDDGNSRCIECGSTNLVYDSTLGMTICRDCGAEMN